MIFFKNKTNSSAQHKSHFQLKPKNALLLWVCQCLNIAVIALELSPWMFAIISLLLAWQGYLLHQNKDRGSVNKHKKLSQNNTNSKLNAASKKMSPLLLGIFALLGCFAIAITAKQAGLLLSMVHLLCFSYVLKAFELRKRSDFYQLQLLGLFVLASSLIFRQDLVFSIITLVLLTINLTVLLQFFSSEKAFSPNIKVVSVLLVQSMLLAIVLFLVFPRLSPFWKVPLANSAKTGLSDTVKPGDIANLSRSTKLAFRVDFNGQPIPSYSQLYWRAMVLEDYDGREWTRQKISNRTKMPQLKTNTKTDNIGGYKKYFRFDASSTKVAPVTYQVITEPSFQRYLFALAPANTVGTMSKTGVMALNDYTFKSSSIITQTKSYKLTSYLTAPLALEISEQSKRANLNYPSGSNPRLEQLALQLKHNYLEPEKRARAVLSLINKQNYSYTLQPPLLKNNSLDQFFFDTQAGFCVHYASAFTFLMRASGIPARMVTGYLGGEFNETGNSDSNAGSNNSGSKDKGHLSIYQYDAHAWSEIWVEGKGWLRVDPTGAVDPERVNSGWSEQLLQQQSAMSGDLFSLYRFKNSAFLNALRLQFDALDYKWTRWVVGFSSEQQYDLLKSWFGNMLPWKLALIIATSLIVSMGMLMYILHLLNRTKRNKIQQTKWQIIYLKGLMKLAKQGLEKPAGMTVNDFAKQVRAQCPELAIAFTRLSASYNSLSYQTLSPQAQKKLILTMQQQYQQFCHAIKNQV